MSRSTPAGPEEGNVVLPVPTVAAGQALPAIDWVLATDVHLATRTSRPRLWDQGPVPGPGRPLAPLQPDRIRVAQTDYVEQLTQHAAVAEDTLAEAFAIPSVTCDNLGCDERHLSEDCSFELRCTGCGSLRHVAHDCQETCERCYRIGHLEE